jgi:5'-phosphate synthase pdxT subunit
MLEGLGAAVREVRSANDLEGIGALVLPGGESTAIMHGLQREGMIGPLRDLLASGLPALGSCAGLILLDREHLGVMDIRAARNAFGRQVNSFEADLQLRAIPGGPLRAVFIRAPWIAEHGQEVEVLAELEGHAVAARQGKLLAAAFHSELADDPRLHQWLLAQAQ